MKTRLTLLTLLVFCLILGAWLSIPFFSQLPQINSLVNTTLYGATAAAFFVAAAIIFQLAGHVLRAIKERVLLEQIRPIKLREVFKGQMIGLFFNALLPFRIGELIRAHYIGKGVLVSRSAVFATILFERLIDLLILVCVSILALGFISLLFTPQFITALIAAIAAALIIAYILYAAGKQQRWLLRLIYHLTRLFNDNIRDRSRMIAWSFIYGIRHTIHRQILPRYLGYSLVMWLCYFISTGLLIALFIPLFSQGALIASTLAAYFGVSNVFGPGYIDNFSAIFSGITSSFFPGSTSTLLFATVLLWLVLIIPSIILGVVFIIQKQRISSIEHNHTLDVMKNKLYRDLDISHEFGNFLDTYFKGSELNIILNNKEIAKKFTVLKTFKGGSNALTILVWQDKKMVVKKITLPQFKDKLAAQYDWLDSRSHLKHLARTAGQHDDGDSYSIDIAYNENFITFFEFIHTSESQKSWQALKKVVNFVQNNIYEQSPLTDQKTRLDKYIQEKVVDKILDAAKLNTSLSQLLGYDTIYVNGEKLLNFDQIVKKIQRNKRAMKDLIDFQDTPIHGDLTIDNVIVEPKSLDYLLLDPNNENAISDAVVDYGKLFQSLHSGYEFLVLLDQSQVTENTVAFEEKKSVQYNHLYEQLNEHLKSTLPESQHRAILFHEAVHYCRMLTYRVNINPETASAFYGIAIRLFNDFLKQYDRKT